MGFRTSSTDYSPLDYCSVTQADINAANIASKKAADALKQAEAAVTTTLTAASAAYRDLGALAATASATVRANAQAKVESANAALTTALTNQGVASADAASKAAFAASTHLYAAKPACTYQSQHARAMAVQGFALADQDCEDFFRGKGDFQQWSSLVSDTSSSTAGLAAGAAGAATGLAALPSASSLLTAVTGGATSVLNKDLLFSQSNIATTYTLVAANLSADTTKQLPEPDTSDWNFKRAIEAIRGHQNICRVGSILASLQSAASSQAQAATCTTPATNAATGASRPASGTPAAPSKAASSCPASTSTPKP
jgi:hypothetical protein